MFRVTEVFGRVGNAEFAFEEGDGVFHFVDFGIGLGDGGFGDQSRDFAIGQFAQHAGLAETGAIAADGGIGVGEHSVVEDMGLLQAGENIVDIGGNQRPGVQFILEFANG